MTNDFRLLKKVSKVFDEEDENLVKLAEKAQTQDEWQNLVVRRNDLVYLRGIILDTIVMDEAE